MRSLSCVAVVLFAILAIVPSPAAADAAEPLDEVLRQVEAVLAAGADSPREIEDSYVRLLRVASLPEGGAAADLLQRLAAELEPLASRGADGDPARRQELLRRAGATLDLLRQKLDADAEPSDLLAIPLAAPLHDACADAALLSDETVSGSTGGATNDGGASCGDSASSPDVWYSYTAAGAGLVAWDTFGSGMDTVLSLHSACPDGSGDHELTCSDDARGTLASLVARDMAAGETVLVRVSGAAGASGSFELTADSSAGGIAGTVTKAGTGEPRPDATVAVFESSGWYEETVGTEADGTYLFGGLDAGDWFVRARDRLLVDEMWDDRPCPGYCDIKVVGDPVTISSGLVNGIDFALAPGGTIEGTVTEASGGGPISNSSVAAYDSTGVYVTSGSADSSGSYRIGGLPAGSYTVVARSWDHLRELYDDMPCHSSCTVTAGTPIVVEAGSSTEGVDFALVRLGSISGTVTRASDGTAVTSGSVLVYDAAGTFQRTDGLDWNGTFRVDRLAPGDHYARTWSSGFVDELYDDLPCEPDCEVTLGAAVEVAAGTDTAGVDFELAELGRIEGRVTANDTGLPVDLDVYLYDGSGASVASAWVSGGNYAFSGLEAGNYFVRTYGGWSYSPYEDQLFDGLGCDPSCDVTKGTPVPVALSTTTAGVDFALARCSLSSFRELTNLTLLGTQTHEACRTVYAGPGVTVSSTGHLVLRSGRSVVLRDGFEVAAGGRLEVAIDPAVGGP